MLLRQHCNALKDMRLLVTVFETKRREFMRSKLGIAGLVLVCGLTMSVCGDEPVRGTVKEAEEMMNKAVKLFETEGKGKAFEAFNDRKGAFVKKDLYIFVVDHDGLTLSHGGNIKLVGKNMKELKDADGKFFIQEMIKTAQKGGGWVDYKWTNPETRKIENKTTLIKPLPGINAFAGCGIYK